MNTALLNFRLPAGIALAMLVLAALPFNGAAGPDLPVLPDKSDGREERLAPNNQFLTAYNSMALADWLAKKNLRTEAGDLYTEALELFDRLAVDYPQWQPAVVSFRINYCREALQRLSARPATVARADQAAGQGAGLSRVVRERGATPDAGRQPALRSPERSQSGEAGTIDASRRTTVNQQSKIESRKSEMPALSPLNFKLQQAALKERGRDDTGALAMYLVLLEEYPQEPWALKGACRCCLRLGYMNKVRALIRQIPALPLPDADFNLLVALVDCQDGRYQAAISRLHQSLKQNSASPEAHVALGVALAATGKVKDAQLEMKRALTLNPKLGDAFYNLARLGLWQKPMDYDTARVHYKNALRHGAAPDPELDALLAE